jgi:signal transduction histidine kinase
MGLEQTAAFARYGFLPELIGRFSRVVAFEPLDHGTLRTILMDGVVNDYIREFAAEGMRLEVSEAVLEHNPEISRDEMRDLARMRAHCTRLGVRFKPSHGWGKLLLEIFEKTVEHTLVQPTFITDHPVEVSPLARANDLDPDIALTLYRVAQEALRNVVQHADTHQASLWLTSDDGTVTLTVRDEGAGFDPDASSPSAGLGLVSIRERVRLVGGEVAVASRPGAGTEVRVSVSPVRAP